MATQFRRKLAILDVGHGNCAVLHDTNGVVVIDAAPGSALLEYLRQEGVRRVDFVLISHADKDHLEGLIALLSSGEIKVDQVRLNSDSKKDSAIWEDLLVELDRREQEGSLNVEVALTRNKAGDFDQGSVRVEVLGPSTYLAGRGPGSRDRKGRRIRTNSISAVVRLVQDGRPVALLPGDLDEIGLDELIHSGEDLSAPLLVFPHHGGRPSVGDPAKFASRLCGLASPQTVVFSIGRGRFGTPLPEIVAGIRQDFPHVRIACTQLSQHYALADPNAEAHHLRPEFSAGRESGKCCAGTLIVELDRVLPLRVLPTLEDHLVFIGKEAPSALCCREPVPAPPVS